MLPGAQGAAVLNTQLATAGQLETTVQDLHANGRKMDYTHRSLSSPLISPNTAPSSLELLLTNLRRCQIEPLDYL